MDDLTATRPPLDRDDLEAALPDTDLRVLLMCVFHLSGDHRWLAPPYRPERDVRLIADESAGLPDDVADEIRAAAVDLLCSGPITPAVGDPGDELMLEMMRWCTGDRIDPDYAPLFREDLALTDRAVRWRERRPDRAADRHVVVVGAGASGIVLGKRLVELGIPFTVLERGDDVGGTWRDNVYPGAAVDTPNHAYSFSTGSRYPWSRNFSPQPELLDYLRRCADEFGVREHVRFGTEVIGARWNDDTHRWHVAVRTADGERDLVATDLVSAIGPFGRPRIPDLPGRDRFAGEVVHSSRWHDRIEVAGRRVVIVGTGASAMQIGPTIADGVEHLTVVQRTPQWARPIPRFHDPISSGAQWLLAHVPFYAEWFRMTMLWRYGDGLLPHLRRDPEWEHPERSVNRVNERHRVEMVEHIAAELDGRPDLIERCIPDYPPYGKRILLDNGWYRMLRRPNVSLVTGTAVGFDDDGIVVDDEDGTRTVAADLVVLSTGFEVNQSVRVLQPVGRGGVTLDEVWGDDDATAHLGITIPGFPNFFVLQGPNTGLGHGGSAIFQAESMVRYVTDAIVTMVEDGIDAIEVRRERHDEYVAAVDARHGDMIWTHPGVSTYYRNAHGRVVLASPWSLLEYWRMTHDVDLDDFEVTRSVRVSDP